MASATTQKKLDGPIAKYIRRDPTRLNENWTVRETLDQLRGQELGERIVYLYVVDNGDRLVGVLPVRRMLMSAPSSTVGEIMIGRVVTVPEQANVLDACELFIQHRFLALPVVDDDRKLLGTIELRLLTDEVFDIAEQRSRADVFQLIGVQMALTRTTPWNGFRGRFPWLLCNIAGGLACALLAAQFEALLNKVVVLALFVPIVLALAESVSMQSMTITLQTMHSATVRWSYLLRSLMLELIVAALLGVAAGGLVASVAWLWQGAGPVALALGASIALGIVTACLLGVALPIAVRAARLDPQISAGPIVLATADVCTLLFYFSLAGWLLGG